MANVAWPGLLAAMSFYLTANLDEELFQSTLKSYQNFTNVCGVLDLVTPRDAFLTNLCKNAIPMIPILSSGLITNSNTKSSTASVATISSLQQTSAVSFSELSAQQQQALANITLNEKSLYSLRVLLNIVMFLSNVLGASWYLVLETLQLADFLLFNRPTPKSSSGTSVVGSVATGGGSGGASLRRTMTNSSTVGLNLSAQDINSQIKESDHVAIIRASFQRLLDNSKLLDDDSFTALAASLCRLSSEISGVPFSADESVFSHKSSRTKIYNIRSFAIDKLQYIVTLDMNRLISLKSQSPGVWDLIMTHLIATANYPLTPSSIRTQCCETIADIITDVINYVISEYKQVDENIQTRLLLALSQCINYTPPASEESLFQETSAKAFSEVQKMALETLNNLLQTAGHSFTCGWGLIFDMLRHVAVSAIGVPPEIIYEEADEASETRASIDTTGSSIITNNASAISNRTPSTAAAAVAAAGSIKVAFASLQLICTDFLSLLSPDCLRQCIATLGSFGMQSEDLNISLTAVGLLWNLSDFIQTRRTELMKEQTENVPIDNESLNIDISLSGADSEFSMTYSILWMLLLLQLSHTCTDWRPEVRNGANQTLFRTISMNGHVLGPQLWNACIWKVLFPLLDSIKMSSIRASKVALGNRTLMTNAAERDSSGFMLHHSRDTADKQWDETKVLILTGISSIFHDFLNDLYQLEHFSRAFTLLLAHLEDSCLRSSQEVSLASIKSLKSLVSISPEFEHADELLPLWRRTWNTWQAIGNGINKAATDKPLYSPLEHELQSLTLSLSTSSAAPISDDFTQDMLTAYVSMFTEIYKLIPDTFTLEDVSVLLDVLRNVLVYSTSPQYRPDIDHLSPLQEAVLDAVQVLDMSMSGVPPLVIADLSEYMTLAFLSPPEDKQKSRGYIPPSQRKFSTVTYIALNKKCSHLIAELFKQHAHVLSIYTDGVFERIIGAYGLPMKLKYDCPPSCRHDDDKTPLWKLATEKLLEILVLGLETLERFGDEVPLERFVGVWRTLVDILEGSLLSPSSPPESMKIEELDVDEHFDISVLSVIQNDIAIYLGKPRVPIEVIQKLMNVIRESSRLYYIEKTEQSVSSDIVGTTGTIVPVMKESFAYAAFMTLFSLCSAENQDNPQVRKRIAKVAIPVLLERCETILRNYTADEPLLGRCPFPRYLMRVRKEEMLFFLKQAIQLKLQENILTIEENSNPVKKLLLSGPRAHLFYLYPSLCSVITCEDDVVISLIQECLQVTGAEMGLSAPLV